MKSRINRNLYDLWGTQKENKRQMTVRRVKSNLEACNIRLPRLQHLLITCYLLFCSIERAAWAKLNLTNLGYCNVTINQPITARVRFNLTLLTLHKTLPKNRYILFHFDLEANFRGFHYLSSAYRLNFMMWALSLALRVLFNTQGIT